MAEDQVDLLDAAPAVDPKPAAASFFLRHPAGKQEASASMLIAA